MVTVARGFARLAKQMTRRVRNTAAKAAKAAARRAEIIALGKTVIVTEKDGVKTYSFPPKPVVPPSVPRLSWVGVKSHPLSAPRKNNSGHKPEHIAALAEDPSQTLAIQIEKAKREIQKENLQAILPATVPAPDIAEVTA